jgi:exopolysaccharide biosynthesis polyprenyl glycosylphosphotransferase
VVNGPQQDRAETAVPAPVGEPARIVRNRKRDSHLRRLLALADLLSFATALWLSVSVFGNETLQPGALATPLLFVLGAKLLGLYDRDAHLIHKNTLSEVPALFSIAAYSVLTLFLAGELFIGSEFSPGQGAIVLGCLFGLLVMLRAGARMIWRATVPPERCLLVGNTTREAALRDALELNEPTHVSLVGLVPIFSRERERADQFPSELLDRLDVDRVIVAPGSHGSDEVMFVIRALRDAGVKVSVIPDVSRVAGSAAEVDPVAGLTLLGMRRFAITRSSRLVKRSFDLLTSATMLVLVAPLMLAIAIAIRIERPWSPILYRQRRIGRYGQEFEILKFRSMNDGAHDRRSELGELDCGAEGFFKIPDDPRVTRVGRLIRRTNLDELPQLINVLRGEMSLVGPRPLIPEEDRNIAGRYRRRLDVRPGMTGHWQVLGSARVPMEEMVKLDYLYVSNWSLWNDIVLIARTVPLITRRRGM